MLQHILCVGMTTWMAAGLASAALAEAPPLGVPETEWAQWQQLDPEAPSILEAQSSAKENAQEQAGKEAQEEQQYLQQEFNQAKTL